MARKSAKCVKGHTAYIFDRGGGRRVAPLIDLSVVQWERVRDGVSEAMIRLEDASCRKQAKVINQISSKRHELVIYRGNNRVWEGPIHRIASHSSFVEIFAKDVLSYLGGQPLTQLWDNSSAGDGVTEVTTRFEDIINYELSHGRTMLVDGVSTPVPAWEALSPPINVLPHLSVHHFANEARTTAKTLPYEMGLLEHLKAMGRTSGIDYTAVGRAIHIWDVSRNIGRLSPWTRANFFNDVIVTEYGLDHAQAAYVVGQEGLYGQALNTENMDFYGPWTTMYTAYQEEGTAGPTQPELNSQARRNLSGRSPVPIEVRVPDNSSLILTDTLTIAHLIPGVQVPLRATMNSRKVAQMQKIDHVTVTETGTSGETVQVTLTPATKPDAEDEV